MFICGTSALCLSTKFITDIKRIYIYIYIYTFYYWDLSLRVILFGRSTQKGMGWAGNVACMGEKRNVYVVVVGKAEGKRPLGRSRNTWKDNVKCFKEIE